MARKWGKEPRKLAADGSVAEIAEKVAVGGQNHGRVVALERGLIGVHRAVEGEEIGIPAEGIREDTILLRIALSARDFRLALGLGDNHRCVAICLAPDFL